MKMPRPARRVYRTLRPGWGSRGGADERWEQVTVAVSPPSQLQHRIERFPHASEKLIAKAPAQRPPGCGLAAGRRTRRGASNRAPSADVCGSTSFPSRLTTVTPVGNRQGRNFPSYRNFAYSASASFRIGISGSASFQRVKSSRYAAPLLSTSPSKA